MRGRRAGSAKQGVSWSPPRREARRDAEPAPPLLLRKQHARPNSTRRPNSTPRRRRRVHMALHTGQHMLSRALADLAQANTVSSRLGETMCTIDVDQEGVQERRIAAAEDLVNSVIDDDVPVRAFFPTAEELAALPL